jgi:uncharacterized membrane protein YkvA (DUF1232 family)
MLRALRDRLRARAGDLIKELHAISGAMRDTRTPWLARALALIILAYAASPIDLIPDFIPVLGSLDDLILVPFGLWLLMRLISANVLDDHRARAAALDPRLSTIGLAIMIMVWFACALLALSWL